MAKRTKRKVPQAVSAYMAEISGKAKGGKARAKSLSPERMSEIAKKAAAARWEQSKLQTGSLKVHGDPLDPPKTSPTKNQK
jgi:hypothetical protein